MFNHDSRQTAYPHNSIKNADHGISRDHGWAAAINALLEQRFAFLAQQFESEGCLFRGMSSGLLRAILDDRFWYFSDDASVVRFEQENDILCVSQDFSDAYAVARLWKHNPDACILILKSDFFNQKLQARCAAMLATAEPGMVFKYPFFTQPLSMQDIEMIVVSPLLFSAIKSGCLHEIDSSLYDETQARLKHRIEQLHNSNKLYGCPEVYNRQSLERQLNTYLHEKQLSGAKPIACELIPKKK